MLGAQVHGPFGPVSTVLLVILILTVLILILILTSVLLILILLTILLILILITILIVILLTIVLSLLIVILLTGGSWAHSAQWASCAAAGTTRCYAPGGSVTSGISNTSNDCTSDTRFTSNNSTSDTINTSMITTSDTSGDTSINTNFTSDNTSAITNFVKKGRSIKSRKSENGPLKITEILLKSRNLPHFGQISRKKQLFWLKMHHFGLNLGKNAPFSSKMWLFQAK